LHRLRLLDGPDLLQRRFQLPQRQAELLDLFKAVRNKKDEEEYEKLLADDKLREEFYERLATYAKTLAIALSSVDFVANTPEARQAAQKERHRPGFEDTVWFRMAVGRRQNADPRWLLPILCRRGHITRNEIGAIRIGPDETFVQVPRPVAGKFADALLRTAAAELAAGEESMTIEPSESGPRETARHNRREGPPGRGPNSGPPRGKAKVHRKGPPKGKHPKNAHRPPKQYSDRKPRD